MNFSKSEIKELSLNQFSESQVNRAFKAFNGLTQLFDKDFIGKRFNNVKCPSEVIYITELWENWKIVEPFKKSHKIIERWKEGLCEQGVNAELFIFAYLIKNGILSELFPCIDYKEPDCSIHVNNQIIYIEITSRERSKKFWRGTKILGKIARIAGETFKGSHAKLAILRLPTDNELKRICYWIKSSINTNEGLLDNLAYFYLDAIESPLNKKDKLMKYLPSHSHYGTYFGKGMKGTAGIYLEDIAANEILKREAKQLSKKYPGIICIDSSQTSSGYESWVPLIKRRFQPDINKRISAVLLFAIALSNEKSLISGCFLKNTFTKYSINDNVETIFGNIFNT